MNLAAPEFKISLHSACHGFGKTALFNMRQLRHNSVFPPDLDDTSKKYLSLLDEEMEPVLLEVDCGFYGLTPLSSPDGEILVE